MSEPKNTQHQSDNTDTQGRPMVTYAIIKKLLTQPDRLHVYIHKISGFYVPFVVTIDAANQTTPHGVIGSDGHVTACQDREELIQVIRDSLGNDVGIYYPGMKAIATEQTTPIENMPKGPTLH